MPSGLESGGASKVDCANLHTCTQNAQYLHLMLRNELGERNEYSNMQRHLSMILCPVPDAGLSLVGGERICYTHRNNSALDSTKYSIQLSATAMMLEMTSGMKMNFKVSAVPHSRSRYRSDGGTTSKDTMSCLKSHRQPISKGVKKEVNTSIMLVSTNALQTRVSSFMLADE